jgi:hypothetical protein
MSDEPIWILTRDEYEAEDGAKGVWDDIGRGVSSLRARSIDPELLKQDWNRTMRLIGQLVRQSEQEAQGSFNMQLDEVTLAVEIVGNGKVNLLGACTSEAGGKGAITLKFKRVESK